MEKLPLEGELLGSLVHWAIPFPSFLQSAGGEQISEHASSTEEGKFGINS